jgi:antitoxin VapB
MDTAKVFRNGRSQAIRLPKEYRFKDKDVYIKKIGDIVVLIPKKSSWDILIKSLDEFSDDFMNNRDQPANHDHREAI